MATLVYRHLPERNIIRGPSPIFLNIDRHKVEIKFQRFSTYTTTLIKEKLTSVPTTGKLNLIPSASPFRILEALAKDEIASPFQDTIT